MRRELTTAPLIEPVTVDEAKLYCRIDLADDDAILSALISSARQYAEHYIHGALINQTWTFYFDADDDLLFDKRYINLPINPLVSVTSVSTFSDANVSAVYANTHYRLSGNRILLNDNYEWPYTVRSTDSAAVVVVAGFGSLATDVPESIRLAIKMLVAQWYDKREALFDLATETGNTTMATVPFGVTALLAPYKSYY
jgi:uncharacterized phiE125 gp8 family phage protein